MDPSPGGEAFPAVQFPGGTTVLVELTADIHICGLCKQQFTNLDAFVAHKQSGCQLTNPAAGTANTVQFVTEETVPPSQPSTQAITSETQTITVSAPEFVFEHGYQTFLPSDGTESQAADGSTTKCLSKKIIAPVSTRRQSCNYPGCQFKTMYGLKDLERHTRTHTGDKPFKCPTCDKAFSRKDKLKTHIRSHTGEKPYKCKECDYCAADSSSLCKHQRIHTNERPFKCQICPYASRNSSQLTVHLRSHTGDAPFQCLLCTAKFKINSDLKRHMRIHTGEKPFRCEFCDFFCAMKGNLKSHIRMKHNSEDTFKCDECDFQCGSKTDLRLHMRSHLPEQPVKCLECNYSCSTRAALKVHERIHSNDRPFKCSYCCFDSKQRSNLTTHIKKCHSDKDEKKPPHFQRKYVEVPRNYHSRRTNKLDAKRSFKCDLCDAAFVREDSLRSHKKQHTDIIVQKSSDLTIIQLQLSQPQEKSNVLENLKMSGFNQVPSCNEGKVKSKLVKKVKKRRLAGSSDLTTNVQESIASNQLHMLSQVDLMATSQAITSRGETTHIAEQTAHPDAHDQNNNNGQHEELVRNGADDSQERPVHQTFINSEGISCTDFEGLNDFIQEETTEVTIVSEGSDEIRVPASQSSPIFDASSQADVPKQNYTIVEDESHSALCPADSIPD